jgi:origin recognition complex subunit 1
MWEDCCGVMWTELMWYMSPEEMHCGRLPAHGAKELFETNRSDETEVASVKRKVHVLPKNDYDALDAEAREDSDTFFCRYHYDPRTKKVLPLLNSVLKSRVEGQYRNPRMGADRLLAFSGPASEAPEGVPSARNVGLGPEEDETADGTSAAPASKFDRAAHMLQLSTVPKTLPCREEEQGQIRAVLREAIQQGQCGGCIYISGVPGTGKTASVHAIIREMTRESESGELPPFSFIEVNCQRLPKPNHLYSLLLQGITGKQAQPVQAATMLDSLFGSAAHARQPTTVVLLDELDHLVTRKQTVLYNMFEWPTRAKANLVVLGVANTMDLPERMLPRIVSRLGLRRISFQPYLHTQLQEVISSRLGQLDAFDATAIQLCARRVAAVSGDVRKALHICRRACDLAREDGVDKVALKHIEAAVKQLFANPYVAAVQTLSHTAQLLLLAALQACEDLAEADVRVDEVTARATELARALGRGETPWSHVEAALATLFDMHLLAARGAPGCRPDRCAPQVLADDVAFALKDDPSLARIAATLA